MKPATMEPNISIPSLTRVIDTWSFGKLGVKPVDQKIVIGMFEVVGNVPVEAVEGYDLLRGK